MCKIEVIKILYKIFFLIKKNFWDIPGIILRSCMKAIIYASVHPETLTKSLNHIWQVHLQRLGRDLSFQNINDELRDPAHKYTAPEGEILVVEKLIRFGTAL